MPPLLCHKPVNTISINLSPSLVCLVNFMHVPSTSLAPMPGKDQHRVHPTNTVIICINSCVIIYHKDGYQPYSDFVPPRPSSDRNYEVSNLSHQKEMKQWVETQRKKASKARRPTHPGIYSKKKNNGFKV